MSKMRSSVGPGDLAEALTRAPWEPRLAFARSEYDRRLAAVRVEMRSRGLDALLVSNTASIGYLTGYDTTMPSGYSTLVVPAEGDLALHCIELEAPCMLLNGTVTDIEVFDWYAPAGAGAQLAEMLAERGFERGTLGIEAGTPESFSQGAMPAAGTARRRSSATAAGFVDATGLVLDVQMIKSDAELACMRTAGTYTEAGYRGALAAVRDGAGEHELAAAALSALVAAGSELPPILPMVMGGARTGWMPHIAYRRDRISRGDPVYFELTGTHLRYSAPAMRSATVGPATPTVQRLADASLATVEALLAGIRPGRTGDDVAGEAATQLREVPEAFFHGGFGYSIGHGFQPSWTEAPMYLARGEERELVPGMTFHLPICLSVPRVAGVGFSESVVVTESGCELLTPGTDRHLTTGS
jgi:Xaa-Pro dipeptidase